MLYPRPKQIFASSLYFLMMIFCLSSSIQAHLIINCNHPLQNKAPSALSLLLENYSTLKKEEQWEKIVFISKQALLEAKQSQSIEQEFIVRKCLFKSYYFLGKLSLAQLHLEQCFALAQEKDDANKILFSLYSLSRLYHALSLRGKELREIHEYSRLAKQFAEKSLAFYKEMKSQDNLLKAKLLLYYGACLGTNLKEGDLTTAEKYVTEAFNIFDRLKISKHTHKAAIQLAEIYLLKKEITKTKQIIDYLASYIQQDRNRMELAYLQARLELSVGNISSAKKYALQAKSLAEQLKAGWERYTLDYFLKLLPTDD